MIAIDGVAYPGVCPISLDRGSEFRTKFQEETQDGTMQRELLGVYFSYTFTCGFIGDYAEYEAFWNDLNKARDFRTIRVPHNQGYLEFQAYFESTSDTIALMQDGHNFYSDFSVQFISRAPNTTPY